MIHALAVRRLRAYARDCLSYSAIAAAEIPLGLLIARQGREVNPGLVAALSCAPPLAATIWAAVAEQRSAGATWGKRAEHLRVRSARSTAGLSRMLVRNSIKIALPWTLGHVVAFGAASGRLDRGDRTIWFALVANTVLSTATTLLALTGSGRTVHDRVSGTRVEGDLGHHSDRT